MAAIKLAIKTGYRLLDTAHVYRNEDTVGQAVRESISDGVLSSRSDIFITSKLFSGYHNPRLIRGAIEHEIGLLGLEYIDLYLIHAPWGVKPQPGSFNLETVSDEMEDFDHLDMWKELESAVDDGLVRAIGVSNFDIEQVDNILQACRIKPLNNQVESHPYLDQSALIKHHKQHDISVTSYMSLGRGDRTKVSYFTVLLPIAMSH